MLVSDYDLSVTNWLGSIMFKKKTDCETNTKSSQNVSK